MSHRAVVVVHRERLAAEGIAGALGAYPTILPIAATSSLAEAEARATAAQAIALDARLAGAEAAASRLRRAGLRVVLIDREREGDEAVRVPPGAPIAALAEALVPGSVTPSRLPLSEQQHRVLSLVARGMTARQLASHLRISEKTVEQHKSRIFAKLGVPNQTAAVRVALARGLERSPT
jgi:DNA-binding CsgD family transcriptional regulator